MAMRVLGIDPGLRITGYAVLCYRSGDADECPEIAEAGVIRLDPKRSVSERLLELETDLASLIARSRPTLACVEKAGSSI